MNISGSGPKEIIDVIGTTRPPN